MFTVRIAPNALRQQTFNKQVFSEYSFVHVQ